MSFTFQSPQMPGLAPAYALNGNPTFQESATFTGIPSGWTDWASGGLTVNARDGAGAWVSAIPGGAGVNGGVAQNSAMFARSFGGAGWYILEADIYLAAGALTGGGILVQFDDATLSTTYESGLLNFTTDPDIYDNVNGAGLVGARYRYRKLVQAADARSVACVLYAMSHWNGFGSEAAANQLNWYQCSIRPATLAEIAAGNAQFGLPVFPILPGQSITVSKAPLWSTKVKRAASGRERRTALWPYPLWQFGVSFEVIRHKPTNDELAALWAFFNTVQGQYLPWLFLDPSDFTAVDPLGVATEAVQQFGVGDGATTVFQMNRYLGAQSASVAYAVAEPIYAPFGMRVFINGAPTTAYTMGPNGKITFTTAPAAGAALTWEGYFYFGCRFLQDDLTFEQIVSQLWSGKTLKFTSLRA